MPVSTRIATGVLSRHDYTHSTIKLVGEMPRSPIRKHNRARKGIKDTDPVVVRVIDGDTLDSDVTEFAKESLENLSLQDVCDGVNFIPDACFGERTGGMSKIQRMDEEIQKWEKVKEAHVKHLPRAVPLITEILEKLKKERAATDENDENTRIVDEARQENAVKERIQTLERALANSQFKPESQNIRAAIAGYKSGDIRYTDQYTLIWNGKIVDTADTYAAFTEDRQERLDRYTDKYGPHWLWWERGLKIHPNSSPRLSSCLKLPRDISVTGFGQYWIKQCFWKRAGWVMRMPSMMGADTQPMPQELSKDFLENDEGKIYCQTEGPKLVFESLLDSGASYPTLHSKDLEFLGIDRRNYAAQSIEKFGTANGAIESFTYEMFVCVVNDDCTTVVDVNDPVWPQLPPYLGGLCPVVQCLVDGNTDSPEGHIGNNRLSGLLPFLACYLSSTPARNNIFLGEDRHDVLGLQRMPGQRRWDVALASTQPDSVASWEMFGNPKVTFAHRNGTIIDQDSATESHNSDWIFNGGTPLEVIMQSHPRNNRPTSSQAGPPVGQQACAPPRDEASRRT